MQMKYSLRFFEKMSFLTRNTTLWKLILLLLLMIVFSFEIGDECLEHVAHHFQNWKQTLPHLQYFDRNVIALVLLACHTSTLKPQWKVIIKSFPPSRLTILFFVEKNEWFDIHIIHS
jgi:hypothetical protein